MNFGKHLLFMCLILGLVACGKKSVVKTDTPPQTFAEAYGDGTLLKRSVPIPITTDPVDSPIPDLGPFFGGLAKMIANIGASLGAGRTEMYFHQPTPELPEQIKEVRLKRVFFYIEPKENHSRRANWFSRIFRGKGNVDFDFIRKLVLRVRPELPDMKKVCPLPDQGKYAPLFPCKDPELTSEKTERYMSYFREATPAKEPDLSKLNEFVILKYNGDKKQKRVLNDTRGAMFMFRTKRPGETNHFLTNRQNYNGLIENMVNLDNVILVELKKDPVVKESFEAQLAADATYLDETLEVEEIEECNESICLDVKVEEANLLPFLKRVSENGVYSNRIDAFVDAGKVPEAFQLKGFLEVEFGARIGF